MAVPILEQPSCGLEIHRQDLLWTHLSSLFLEIRSTEFFHRVLDTCDDHSVRLFAHDCGQCLSYIIAGEENAIIGGSFGREFFSALRDKQRTVGILLTAFIDEALLDFVLTAVRKEIKRDRRVIDVAEKLCRLFRRLVVCDGFVDGGFDLACFRARRAGDSRSPILR